MKNKYLLLLFLVTINIFSQDPKLSDNFTVEVGEEYEETDGEIKVFFKHKNYIVAINSKKSDLIIQKFDPKTLKELKRVDLKKFMKSKGGNKEIMQIGDKAVFFYEAWDRSKQIESLMAVNISLEDLTVGDPYTFLSQQGKIVIVRHKLSSSKSLTIMRVFGGKYFFKKSFDNKKLLVTYRLKPEFRDDSKSFDRIAMHIFDSDLKLEWNEVVEMPYTEKKMNNGDYTIDREGNFYMLATVYEDDSTDEKKKNKEDANYHLELFKIKKNTNSIIKNKIEIGDKFIDEASLYENAKGDIVIAGTCKNPDKVTAGLLFSSNKQGQATGVFTIKLDKDGAVSNFKSYDFPVEMLNKYSSKGKKRNIKKNEESLDEKPSFNLLKINSIALNKDGSFLILGEQRYILQKRDLGEGFPKRNEVFNEDAFMMSLSGLSFHFRDILVAKINADGSLAWMHKLPKRQKGVNRKRSMSYTHMFAGDHHYLLYLDNVKNLNLPEDKVPYQHTDGKGGYFTAYIINDKTGEVKKESIFNTREIKGKKLEHFETEKILPLSDSEILIEGFNGRSKDFLIKVTAKQ
ncbi:hypothetical protein [Aquimarina muelleri]|uniref:Uncharacterized protein n=1 Tax=Aquimarina muelleri TaxID=279356 RepID=A0A918N151_9FLAO|nr:hypothetical protein [Aquimarina muelleri]MCX2761543.1 hypothetical protein [Aquimarina muelleri]GGX07941.1 hypothetical protein GCM10007384_07200 [Aquimarina muelleri]